MKLQAHHRAGFTMIEILVAMSLVVLVMFMIVEFQGQLMAILRHTTAQQTLTLDARRCSDMLTRQLSNAQASTIRISTPGPGAPPYSQIDFVGADQSVYTILWSTSPANSIHLLRTPAGGGVTHDSVMASNVSVLMFYINDFRDPSMVRFTVQLQTPYNGLNAQSDSPLATALIANQMVRPITRQ